MTYLFEDYGKTKCTLYPLNFLKKMCEIIIVINMFIIGI